jgi:hypothetical protein
MVVLPLASTRGAEDTSAVTHRERGWRRTKNPHRESTPADGISAVQDFDTFPLAALK